MRRCHGRVGAFFTLLIGLTTMGQSFAVEGPALRTGLWMTQKVPQSQAELDAFARTMEQNSKISGVYIHIGWKDVEKEPGKYDFNAIDKTVEVIHRANRKYTLGVKPGFETPAYIFQQGGQPFQTQVNNPHRANFGAQVEIPIPWDPVYQRNFSRVIEEAGKRYADDPLCVGVVLMCANFMSAEMHLPKRPEDKAKWKAMGDYQGKLLEVYKKYTDEWAKAFPKQQICLHISQVLDLPSSFFEKVIEYGMNKFPDRFTLQTDQLSGRKEDTGVLSYG